MSKKHIDSETPHFFVRNSDLAFKKVTVRIARSRGMTYSQMIRNELKRIVREASEFERNYSDLDDGC
jgi:transketolase C-terminal domain/subunit